MKPLARPSFRSMLSQDELEFRVDSFQPTSGGGADGDYEVLTLPSGDHKCINIDWDADQDPAKVLKLDSASWLNNGKKGVIIRGQGAYGPNATNIRPTGWDKVALAVGRHSGEVIVQNCRIFVGYKGIHFGESGHSIVPGFKLVLSDCYIDGQDPNSGFSGQRGKWGTFTYQGDLVFRNTIWNCPETAEHAHYGHGDAGTGATFDGCEIIAAGAEGIKTRTARWLNGPGSEEECAWSGPDRLIMIRDTQISNWFHAHSDRGGAGIVMQGTGCHIWIERVALMPGSTGHIQANPAQRSYCIAVSSEGEYDMAGGWNQTSTLENPVDGNGYVTVKSCIMAATGPGQPDYTNKIIRVGKNGGMHRAASALRIEGVGCWGENMQVEMEHMQAGQEGLQYPLTILGCNSPTLAAYAERPEYGMDTTHEAVQIKQGLKPLSVDYSYDPPTA